MSLQATGSVSVAAPSYDEEAAPQFKLFVGGLSYMTTPDTLRTKFEEIGPVVNATVIEDKVTMRSRGFGFVTYASAEHCQSAIQRLSNAELDGRNIRVGNANEQGSSARRRGPSGSYYQQPYNKSGGGSDSYSRNYDQNSRSGGNGGGAYNRSSRGYGGSSYGDSAYSRGNYSGDRSSGDGSAGGRTYNNYSRDQSGGGGGSDRTYRSSESGNSGYRSRSGYGQSGAAGGYSGGSAGGSRPGQGTAPAAGGYYENASYDGGARSSGGQRYRDRE